MNPRAAEELLNLIMLDDMVARRKALDDWSRRWLATAEVALQESRANLRAWGGLAQTMGALRRAAATDEIFKQMTSPEAPDVLHLERGPDVPGLDADVYYARMYFIREVPRGE